jgi:hypothetical protein
MKLWLLALAVAIGLFVAGSALLAQPIRRQAALPNAISLTSVNTQGAALTQTIHQRSTIERLVTDLDRLSPLEAGGASCDRSTAGRYRAVLGDANGGRMTVIADKAGCHRIVISGKGWSAGRSWTDPILLRDFDALFPPSWQTGV